MVKVYIFLLLIFTLLISACTTTNQSPQQLASNFINREKLVLTTKQSYPAHQEQDVLLYNADHKPITPYRVIGVASVSHYNFLGVKRDAATVQKMIKKLAASAGGDALINIQQKKGKTEGHIVQFQQIVL